MDKLIPQEVVQQKIFVLRNHNVLLSNHLAELYGVETRALIQAVKRNIKRFPQDFMFALTREEILRISQFVISLKYSKSVYAFTEQGVAMLSGVLNSNRAIQVNIAIMRAFVKIREILVNNRELVREANEIKKTVGEHGRHIALIYKLIDELGEVPAEKTPKRKIGFNP